MAVADLGLDYSGNGNYWTPNNFSVTAGAGNDSLVDTPTPYGTDTGAGGEVRGNYATLNPLAVVGSPTLSNGNLDVSISSVQGISTTVALPNSGKWYCEIQITSSPENNTNELIGITSNIGTPANIARAYGSNGQYFNGSSWVSFGNAWSQNDVIGVAVDIDNSQISFYKNNTLQGSTQSYTFPSGSGICLRGRASGTSTFVTNFGQRPFAYTAPSGFKALCTTNLPTPTIGATSTTQANKYFNPVLYTGTNSAARTITGVGFQPDFVWVKKRSASQSHFLWDAVRGNNLQLFSDLTDAQINVVTGSVGGGIGSAASDGFNIVAGTGSADNLNNSDGSTYVAWNWKANGAGSSNTAGTITSTVSANTTAGFSIVTYTGNGTSGATVGHGLGVAPSMIFVKRRTTAGASWLVYHSSMAATPQNNFLVLNATDAVTASALPWNNTAPTSTLITLGTSGGTNNNTDTFVAYCFAAVAGYSAFGSYTGNGSADGPFVFCGFRPRYVLIKRSDSADSWIVVDTARNTSNLTNLLLYPNSSGAEGTGVNDVLDILSNGFKIRGTGGSVNINTGTYIYAAFAESPFKYSLAR